MLHPVLGKSHVSHTVSFITNDTPTCSISVLTSWYSSWFHWNAIWCVCVHVCVSVGLIKCVWGGADEMDGGNGDVYVL
jgi:hypothetical protein